MKLNIYNLETHEIEKTYEVETYDIYYKTTQEVVRLLNLGNKSFEEITSADIINAIGLLMTKENDKFRWLMKDIFIGLTDEELERTKISEIRDVLVEVMKYTMRRMVSIGNTEKN